MPELINWDLIRNPLNWIIVVIMCLFALTALSILYPQTVLTEA
jgi:hypothetical protein